MGAALLRAGRCEGCRLELSGSGAARVKAAAAGRGGALRGVPADPGPYGGVRACSRMAGRRLKVIVEADGGVRGNPGPAGYGAVVCEARTGEVLRPGPRDRDRDQQRRRVRRPDRRPARGRRAGRGRRRGADGLQARGRADGRPLADPHRGLRPLAAQAAELVRRFDTVRFIWMPREQNAAPTRSPTPRWTAGRCPRSGWRTVRVGRRCQVLRCVRVG